MHLCQVSEAGYTFLWGLSQSKGRVFFFNKTLPWSIKWSCHLIKKKIHIHLNNLALCIFHHFILEYNSHFPILLVWVGWGGCFISPCTTWINFYDDSERNYFFPEIMYIPTFLCFFNPLFHPLEKWILILSKVSLLYDENSQYHISIL